MFSFQALRRTARALCLLALCGPASAFADGGAAPTTTPTITRAPALPVWFEPNVGQFPADVRFASTSTHARLALTSAGFDVTVSAGPGVDVARTLSMRFAGARADGRVEGQQPLPGVSHYYLGNDRTKWREHVPQFAGARYSNVWEGIDAIVYGAADWLEYDFIVGPGQDARTIGLEVTGADKISIGPDGALVVTVGGAHIVQRAPVAYQEVAGSRTTVDAAYTLHGDRVGFTVGAYDRTRPLVIDPIVIVYASFLGGSSTEFVEAGSQTAGVAIDAAGNVIVALDTNSTDLPSATNSPAATPNIAIVKLNPTASAVLFTTYLGGNEFDSRGNIDIDASGNVYLSGRTTSTDLPVTPTAIRTTIAGTDDGDGLLARFSPAGTLQFLTYIGGTGTDSAEAVAFADGKVYVTGSTSSTNLPVTTGAAQSTLGGNYDAWVARLDLESATPLEYMSYVGGTALDAAFSVVVDTVGRFTIAGTTVSSTGFPVTLNARQVSLSGGADAFVTRFGVNGAIDYSTYLGGSSASTIENAKVALDATGAFLLTGFTDSADFPAGTSAAVFQATKAAGSDVFVARLDPSLAPSAQLTARTFVGGSNVDGTIPAQARGDFGIAVAQDAAGNVHVTGFTSSSDFPTTAGGDTTYGGSYDAFLITLDPTLSTLLYSTFIGGAADDRGYAVMVDATKAIHVVGRTTSLAPFTPTAGGGGAPVGPTRSGTVDAFVVKFADNAAPTATGIAPISGATTGGTPFTITGTNFLIGATVTFGGTPATSLQVTSTSIVGLAPANAAGNVAVTVRNPDGQSVLVAGGFTYVVPGPAPAGIGVTPTTGSIVGGTSVTITGTNFMVTPLTTVTFDLAPATNVVVVSDTTITATTPAHVAGAVDVRVTNPDGGTGVLAQGFTYLSDSDGDGIPDDWEVDNGLDPTDPTDGDDDSDDDGASNEKEYQDGTDPNAAETKYFAEGATIGIFTTQFAVANPDRFRTATTVFEFQTKAGAVIKTSRAIGPLQRVTVRPGTDVTGLEDEEFSTVIRSNLFIAADRTMTWDDSVYGSHAETGVASPNATWYLAEGATIGSFNLFYLIQNPNVAPATVRVKYLLANGAPVEKDYTIPGKSRDNIWVNFETIDGVSLSNRELSAVLTTSPSTPIIVERAMYLDAPGQVFNAGHESAGVNQPSTNWFLAEGATGSFMDMFILVANANATTANLTVQYLLTSGAPITRTYQAAANSRFNIWVDLEPGLEDVAVSTVITSDVPVIAERALWWPSDPSSWYEAHNSPGTTATGQTWALGEGEVGGDEAYETYVLVANTSTFAGTARVTLLFEDGSPSVSKDIALPANSRVNVPVGESDANGGFGAAAQDKRFGVLIESLGATPAAIVVERAMYATQGTQFWAAGSNALAARVR